MDNGTKFLQQSFQISASFEQLLNFLFNSDAPVDLLKDMLLFKEKFDRYRKSFAEAYLKGVCKSGIDKESKLQESDKVNPVNN